LFPLMHLFARNSLS